MKYIKQYENIAKEQYWKINCENIEKMKVALYKVGLTGNEEIFDALILDPNLASWKYIYLLNGRTERNEPYWFYSFEEDQFKEIDNVKYNGEVEVTDVDIQINKYNL